MATNRLRVAVSIDGQTHIAMTRWTQPSAHVLTAHTVIPEPPLAIEVHSSFVGHPGTEVHATHLLLGPIGADCSIDTKPLETHWYQPGTQPHACLGEHFVQIVELLTGAGYDATVHAPTLTPAQLGA